MTSAELKSSRRALGLSAEGFASFVGVASGRTVRRWEDGSQDIPGPVIRLVLLARDLPGVKAYLAARQNNTTPSP